jgi:neutral ceramidase
VRALAVEDTCWVTVDVCGLHEDTCAEVEARLPLAPGHLAVTATHTHSGPACTPGRLGGDDPLVRGRIVDAVVDTVTSALAARQPASLHATSTRGAGVAVDRRAPDRRVDPPVDLLRFDGPAGTLAWFVVYPCHPVVLSADNRLISGDYAAFLRTALEENAPGSVALFLPGTAGDINNGHAAEASFRSGAQTGRTFAEAERIGRHLARHALAAASAPVPTVTGARAARTVEPLRLEALDREAPSVLAARWVEQMVNAPEGQAAVLRAWVDWAARRTPTDARTWDAAVTVMRWGAATVVGLPGEPFLSCADAVRDAVSALHRERGVPAGAVLVTGYTTGCPGYLPPSSEYDHGGYEVVDAHRYYGMPAPFARGSVERLQERAVDLAALLLDARPGGAAGAGPGS